MSQNDDLDMQTFQIYQDEESVPVPAENVAKKKTEKRSVSNQGGSNNTDAIKGLAIGLGILILFVVLDQLKLF